MKKIHLKPLEPADVTQAYVDWMNDPEVVQYTMQADKTHSFEDVKAFVHAKMQAADEFLFGIYLGSEHIGNIKIGPLNTNKNCADISYIIGKKQYWGQGLSTLAVKEMCEYAFRELNLARLEATIFANNVASQKVLEKNGFHLSQTKENNYLHQGRKVDGLVFTLTQ